MRLFLYSSLFLIALGPPLLSQETVDHSTASRVSPYPIRTFFPGACKRGDMMTYQPATPGSDVYICGNSNDWNQLTPPSSGGTWGSITGTLSAQTDLNTALAAKAATSSLAPVATSGSASDLSTGTLNHARLPALVSADIPNNAANTSGNAATATALTGYKTYVSTSNGMVCDNSTDDTTAFNALLSTVNTAGGGTIFLNGICKITGAVVLPNDGATPPRQKAIRITGAGSTSNGQWSALPASPSGLELRYNGAKLDTVGIGLLEIDHVTLSDTSGSDCGTFVRTTNTTLRIHDAVFTSGSAATAGSNCYTAIQLGYGTTSATYFQGYDTIITGNLFDGVSVAAAFGPAANAIKFTNNTVNSRSGGVSMLDFSATTEFHRANVITGNVLEDSKYTHAVLCGASCIGNYFAGNQTWDPLTTTTSVYEMTGSANNIVITSHDDVPSPVGSWVLFNGCSTSNTCQSSGTNSSTLSGHNTFQPTSALPGLNIGSVSLAGSDPSTSLNGDMYYNSNSNKFRCYENGAWANCVGGPAGQGVPTGGTAGQVLSKIDSTNYNTQWSTVAGASVSSVSGTTNQVTCSPTTGSVVCGLPSSISGVTGLTPGGNLVVTQNSVAAITSVESGAVANSLYISAGQVGMGTASPSARLHVYGVAYSSMIVDAASNTEIDLRNAGTNFGYVGSGGQVSGGTSTDVGIKSSNKVMIASGGTTPYLTFNGSTETAAGLWTFTGAGANGTVTINHSSAPNLAYQVSGTQFAATGNSSALITSGTSGDLAIQAGSGHAIVLATGGTALANIRLTIASGGAITASNTFAATTLQSSTVYTVATLPTCNSGAEGTRVAISDLLTPAFLTAAVGGGTTHGSGYCNGTAWVTD